MVRKLPKGWRYLVLGDCIKSIESGVSVNGEDRPAVGSGAGVLKVSSVADGRFVPNQNKRIMAKDLARARLNPRAKSMIMSRANTPDLVGSVAYVEDDHPSLFLSDKLWQIRVPEDGPISTKWLSAILSSPLYRKQITELATGSSKSMQNISQCSFLSLEVPAPALDEQRRILSILDAANRQIEISEEIARQRTDEVKAIIWRLTDGFTAARVDLASVVRRVKRNPEAGREAVPLTISAEIGLVAQSRFFDKRIASDAVDTYTLIRCGEFAYNKSYSNGYPYGVIRRLEEMDEGILSSLYLCFQVDDQSVLNGDYLAAVCESGFFNRQIHMIAREGARNHGLLNVNAEDFFAMTLPLPAMKEQGRIAEFVRCARMRVQQSLLRVEMLKEQKSGLMQELLSGRKQLTYDLPGMESADV